MSKFSEDLPVSQEGFELYYSRVEDDIKSMSDIQSFFKKLSSAEANYAKELSKICKSVDPKLWKRTEKEFGTLAQSWTTLHTELEHVSKAHEELAVMISKEIVNESGTWLKEKERQGTNLSKSGTKLRKDMNDTLRSLKDAKENYYKLHKQSDQINATYSTKKSEPQVKPKEVEKLKKKANDAKEKAVAADVNYKKVLEKANSHQSKFYSQEMPSLLDEFQKFEEDKTAFFKKIMQDYMGSLSRFPALLSGVCDTLNASVNAIDQQADIKTFISDNRIAAVTPPSPIEYEPYEAAGGGGGSLGGGSLSQSLPSPRENIDNSGGEKPREKKEDSPKAQSVDAKSFGLSSEDNDLPPEERKAKLEAQLKKLNEVIATEVKSKKGLDKLVKFFAEDPVAQKKATQEAAEQDAKVNELKEQKKKLVAQLSSLGGADESNDNDDERASGSSDDEDIIETKARALFDYDAANETELSFKAGDILTVSEQDQSGWWYAELNGNQGFVPNNYVEEIKE